ncbi:MAG: hypothetical protein HC933_13235 [Pleurocapsa sp. SU_196_0]|nr:hypothetical protein [Pleurocapsa sp. SU_196_0]
MTDQLNPQDAPPKDADLATLPKQQREKLIDAERTDEMDEHATIRVDGKKLPSAADAEAALEKGVRAVLPRDDLKPQTAPTPETVANMGATEEQVDRSLRTPPDGQNADTRKEDTPG